MFQMNRVVQYGMGLLFLAGLAGCADMNWSNREEPLPQVANDRAFIDARTTLLQAAVDKNPLIRTHAMEAIGKTMTSQQGSVLVAGLGDEYPSVQFAAAMALGDMVYMPGRQKLVELILDPQTDQRVVCGAIYALHKMGNNIYTGQLGAILNSDFSSGRATAAMIMGKIGNHSATGPLRSLQSDEQNADVEFALVEALSRLNDTRSQNLLESYARGPYLDMRLAAIPAIADIRIPRAQVVMQDLQAAHNPPRVRVSAAGGMGVLGLGGDVEYLIALDALRHPQAMFDKALEGEEKVRATPEQVLSLQRLGAMAMGDLRDARALGLLHAQLKHSNGGVRVASAMAIMKILSPRVKGVEETVSPSGQPAAAGPARGKSPKLQTSGGLD